jgi:putative two-component system response regulator
MPINDDWNAKTVTVVDDEPSMRDVLTRAARSWHYACQAAASAEEAVSLLERSPTPIVVTDLRMPGNGGVWLVRQIQSRWPATAVIVITAGEDTGTAMDCLAAGAERYFVKPINLEEFRHAIESTLQAHRVQEQGDSQRRQLELAVHRQMRRVRRTFLSAIDSLVRTLEARHPDTKGHSLRVRRYALRLAAALDLDPRQRRQLSLAAKLHDIGKVGTPEAILSKPGRLTPEEFAVVREHPLTGERILSPIVRNPAVLAAIRSHHERPDGKGYPDGLIGDQIPVLARIIAIADCFDALTSSRAYRRPLPVQAALEELRAGSGPQFEPEFVRAFVPIAPSLLAARDAFAPSPVSN